MAKKVAKVKSMEEPLWDTANKLRGSVELSEYKHVVLSLIFLKYVTDRFTERYNQRMNDVLFIDLLQQGVLNLFKELGYGIE
jgi:type I restriction enzyme M protein